MRIVVVDDYPQARQAVVNELRSDHELVTCDSPSALDALLAEDHQFDLAFVDMVFATRQTNGQTDVRGGLGAMASLASVRPRGIPSIIYTSDTDENRFLLCVAAREVFDPVGMVAKLSGGDAITAAVCSFEDHPHRRSFPQLYGFDPLLMPRLIPNLTALSIWRALVSPAPNTQTIADRAFESRRTVDEYLADDRVVGAMRDAVERMTGEEQSVTRTSRITPAAAFARQQAVFFSDPTLEQLVANRWRV